MIDIERIKARAEAATPIMLVGAMVSKNNAEFLKSAKGDVLALIAEVEQLQEKYNDLNTRYNILFTAFNKEIAETERLQSELATVTAERDAAVGDMKVSYKCCICKDYELCCKLLI